MGRPERAIEQQAHPAGKVPATEWIAVHSRASSNDSDGSTPASRRASMVLPEPGEPIISRLWPPAAADLKGPSRKGLPPQISQVEAAIDGVARRSGRR